MAEIGETKSIIEGEVIESAQPERRSRSGGARRQPNGASGSPGAQTGPNVQKQFDIMYIILAGVIVVLFVGFYAAIIAYFQFVQNSNDNFDNAVTEFNSTVREYNDERDNNLENRIQILENRLDSSPNSTPTLYKPQ